MSVNVTAEHIAQAEAFVARIKGADGLAKVDLEKFWADNARAQADPWLRYGSRLS